MPLTDEAIAEIDAFVDARMEALRIPGVAIAIIEDGEIIHAKGFGVTREGGEAVTADTLFQIGSISKPFTATAIMKLVEAGEIGLDDPVVDHLPWFRTSDAAQSAQITIRHLLAHRSGISTFDGNHNQDGGSGDAKAMEDAVRDLSRISLSAPPGEIFQYSNANYQILGVLIETVTGEPFERATRTLILGDAYPQTNFNRDLRGYRYWLGAPRLFTGETGRAILAQGGVQTSANELAAFLQGFMRGDRSILAPETLAEMMTPYAEDDAMPYGLGWMRVEFPDHSLVFHTGSNPGFAAIAGFSPDASFGFVVLANANQSFGIRNVESLTRGVGDLVMGRPPRPVSPPLSERISALLVYTTPIILVLLTLHFGWKWLNGKFRSVFPRSQPLDALWRLVLPSLILAGIAFCLLVAIPQMNGAPMSAISRFNPDLGLALQAGGYLALALAVLRPVVRLRI